jgi:hypothetical protein
VGANTVDLRRLSRYLGVSRPDDPGTLSFLCDLAISDPHEAVRWVATQALGASVESMAAGRLVAPSMRRQEFAIR